MPSFIRKIMINYKIAIKYYRKRTKKELLLIYFGIFGLSGLLLSIFINGMYSVFIFLTSASILTLWLILLLEIAFQEYITYKSIKIFGTLVFSLLVLYASSLSAHNINNIFGVDSSIFPYTHIILTAIEFFMLLTPLFIVLLVVSFMLFSSIGFHCVITENLNRILVYMVSIIGFIVGLVYLFIYAIFFNEINKKNIIYNIAHIMDFKKKSICKNIDKKYSIVYLGINHKKVLIDDRDNENIIPTNFKVVNCNIKSHL